MKNIQLEYRTKFEENKLYVFWNGSHLNIGQIKHESNGKWTLNNRMAHSTPLLLWDEFKERYTARYGFNQNGKFYHGSGKFFHANVNSPFVFIFWNNASPLSWINLNDEHLVFKSNGNFLETVVF